MKDWVGKTAVVIARKLLDLNYYITAPYTPERWNDEMRGISDAIGESIWTIR